MQDKIWEAGSSEIIIVIFNLKIIIPMYDAQVNKILQEGNYVACRVK